MAELLRYPIKNIGSQDDYFKIQVLEYKAPSLNLTGGFAQEPLKTHYSRVGVLKILWQRLFYQCQQQFKIVILQIGNLEQ